MSTSLMFVVLACCCFGAYAGPTDAPALSITLTKDNKAQLKCVPDTSPTVVITADKFKFYKKGETVEFTDAGSDEVTNKYSTKDITVTAATAGEYVCQFFQTSAGADIAARTSAESASVKLGFGSGSAAPRIVESMTLTLACLLAAVAKSHM